MSESLRYASSYANPSNEHFARCLYLYLAVYIKKGQQDPESDELMPKILREVDMELVYICKQDILSFLTSALPVTYARKICEHDCEKDAPTCGKERSVGNNAASKSWRRY